MWTLDLRTDSAVPGSGWQDDTSKNSRKSVSKKRTTPSSLMWIPSNGLSSAPRPSKSIACATAGQQPRDTSAKESLAASSFANSSQAISARAPLDGDWPSFPSWGAGRPRPSKAWRPPGPTRPQFVGAARLPRAARSAMHDASNGSPFIQSKAHWTALKYGAAALCPWCALPFWKYTSMSSRPSTTYAPEFASWKSTMSNRADWGPYLRANALRSSSALASSEVVATARTKRRGSPFFPNMFQLRMRSLNLARAAGSPTSSCQKE
mmetsp:Transcript_5288/g.15755  ORF Transcript_5288/g.15755 Transcript_5288/m.15755 type:complete len:265 (-) Transcript_5288:1272-2066(-)